MISITISYLYYHRFIHTADFYGAESAGGIYAVLGNIAVKPIQFRILIPVIFIALKTVVSIFHQVPDKAIFSLLTVAITYFILLSFYFLLNEYFKSKAVNAWLSGVIIYPMMWNYLIVNGQFFYMDFSCLLVIILGFYLIVKEKPIWLLVLFFFGLLNHPSAGYLIPAYLIFNYKSLLKKSTIFYSIIMSIMYIATYKIMEHLFIREGGYFIIYNLPRNLSLFHYLPIHILVRDALLNFGGMHIFLFIFLFSGLWKRFRGRMLYINLVIVPYIVTIWTNFSIEENRNYIAIIPFVVILFLLYLSTYENSFLKVTDKFSEAGDN